MLMQFRLLLTIQIWAEARFDVGTDDDKAYMREGKGEVVGFDAFTGNTHNEENVYSLGARYTF